MKFQLYQIVFTDNELDDINSMENPLDHPKLKAKTAIQFDEWVHSLFGHYSHVANITAKDLEHAFLIGNIGPETSIERLEQMYSVSVGDILKDDNNEYYLVQSVGFAKVM